MNQLLTLDVLKQAVASHAAAFRCITEYQPMGGPGDKVFPPTYEGGKYATEKRVNPDTGEIIDCVLLDSVQSQANRMELALLEAWRSKDQSGNRKIELPVITTKFQFDDPQYKSFSVTSLEAPHRIADAIFRDSKLNGVMFRKSEKGKALDNADTRNVTGLFGLCPTALVFGIWDSTGPRGGLGAKFQRALVSEMIGINAVEGAKTSSRIDPLQIQLGAGPLYERSAIDKSKPNWTRVEEDAKKEKNQLKKLGKDGKPSEANHGNIKPVINKGSFTISQAQQTTVLSLAALRRLRFPLNGSINSLSEVDQAARTVLAALGLVASVLVREEGADLRSRCQLFPQQEFVWELLDIPGHPPKTFILDGAQAVKLFNDAVMSAKAIGLPWEDEILLSPSEDLLALVQKSQELSMHQAEGDD
ncbi:MAG: type I-G CRISPR-associated RAMP protein Csb1/Cas7g [Methylobacter sp.]